MNPKYQKLETESDYEYGLRLIEIKVEQNPPDLEWADIVDYVGLDIHHDTLRKAANVTPYSGYNVMKYFKEKRAVEGVSGDSGYMDEIENKIKEFQKERQRFFDQRREYNKMVHYDGRREHLYDVLESAANNLSNSVGVLYDESSAPAENCTCDESEGVLVFSDWHYGLKTENVFNQFNIEICKDRVKLLVSMARDRMLLHHCNTLHIVVLGDLWHGAIHTSARVASEEIVCDQIMQVSEILAQSIEELSKYVPKIIVYTTYGNHARTVQNKNDSIHRDNMERLVPWWLSQRLRQHDNIEIAEDSGSEFLFVNACGHDILASHGDLDNVKNSPTLLTTLFHKKMNKDIEYILLGDKHHSESFESLGVNAVICGSLCGTDDYANGKRLYSTPSQLFLIVKPDCGIDAEYRLKVA